jgi:6-phosphogluconolactonase/glucosamine-6-phosphate isomerase/deaminase
MSLTEGALEKVASIGLHHLLDAKVVVFFANGEEKTDISATALEGDVTNEVPPLFCKNTPTPTFFI